VEQGGVSVNGEKVSTIDTVIARDIFNEGLVLKKGKKSFKKVVVK
jgi:tyrosyl-tRNA synthetase